MVSSKGYGIFAESTSKDLELHGHYSRFIVCIHWTRAFHQSCPCTLLITSDPLPSNYNLQQQTYIKPLVHPPHVMCRGSPLFFYTCMTCEYLVVLLGESGENFSQGRHTSSQTKSCFKPKLNRKEKKRSIHTLVFFVLSGGLAPNVFRKQRWRGGVGGREGQARVK